MGPKITVDSATLMNKAFEVIEAHYLFGIPWENIDVVIHPQSIIHSMVEFVDGTTKAHLGQPDMRLPIQYALFHPERVRNDSIERFDPVKTGSLTFEEMEPDRYPCFELALDYARRGGTWPAALCGRRRGSRGPVPVPQDRLPRHPCRDTGGDERASCRGGPDAGADAGSRKVGRPVRQGTRVGAGLKEPRGDTEHCLRTSAIP